MDRLEERAPECDWMAWAHRDHSNHDHVHVIAVLERRLDRDDLCELREHADDAWQRECERCRDPLEIELARELDREREERPAF
jgi:hypothetical protein